MVQSCEKHGHVIGRSRKDNCGRSRQDNGTIAPHEQLKMTITNTTTQQNEYHPKPQPR